MTLSNQAIGAVMMALQNAILNEEDVTEILKGFTLGVNESNELEVHNPPTVAAKVDTDDKDS